MTALTIVMCIAVAVIVGSTPAAATQQQICDTAFPGLCLNDTLGKQVAGNEVQMWNPNATNEDFHIQTVNRCNGSDRVTSNCPFANTTYDKAFAGATIAQLEYESTAYCVATPINVYTENQPVGAVLGKCNNSSGFTGAYGTIFIVDSADETLTSLWVTDQLDNQDGGSGCLADGGAVAQPALYSDQACTPWSGI